MRGGPGGKQRVAGSSLPNAELYSLYFASAQGWYGTRPPPTIPPGRPTSIPAGVPVACHTPDMSGFPSAVRGRAWDAAARSIGVKLPPPLSHAGTRSNTAFARILI